jgi:hypothetical protein
MKNAHYSTAEDYFAAIKLNNDIKRVLKEVRQYLVLSSAEFSDNSKNAKLSTLQVPPTTLLEDIEQMLMEISHD